MDQRPAGVEGEVTPGQPTTEKVRGIFSRIARTYDLVNMVASLGIDRLWRRVAVKAAGLESDSRVLDLAAGTGDLTVALARQAAPAEVVSTDFVPEMLAVARKKAARLAGPTVVTFEEADAQALQFGNDDFDAATIAFGLRNLPDRTANFREVLRVLRPGGRYVILEFSTPPNPLFRAFYHAYLRLFVPLLGAVLAADREAYRYLNDSIREFPNQEALAKELREAGFSEVTWRNLTGGIVAIHVGVA